MAIAWLDKITFVYQIMEMEKNRNKIFFSFYQCLCRFWLRIGIYQSKVDENHCRAEFFASEWYWLAEGLGLMPVFISVLCPFTFLCPPSLPPADVGAWWLELVTVLSDLIEMYWSHVLLDINRTAWIPTKSIWKKHAGFLVHVCVTFHSFTLSRSHWCQRKSCFGLWTGWPWRLDKLF